MKLSTILASAFLPASIVVITTYAPTTNYRVVVDHPGKYELIYLGYQIDHPERQKAIANNKEFFATKSTIVPSIQSMFLLENTSIKEGDAVLDMGTGSGIQAIFAAEKASKVVATDLDPNAIIDATFNAKHNQVEQKIEFRKGDLFEPIKDGETFDAIIFNIDYPYDETSAELWEVHERFFRQVRKYMKPDATIFYQAGWIWNIPRIHYMLLKNGLVVVRMNMANAQKHYREPIVFTIKENPGLAKQKLEIIKKVNAATSALLQE